jgi:hypothetical protein
MPAGFLVADLLCLVTHGILKADMFEAGVALFSKRSILVDFGVGGSILRQVRKRVLGQEHPDTLTSMADLASTYRNQG